MSKKENDYQAGLIKKLESIYPDAIILKNDSSYCQGIPDLSIFEQGSWGMLEVKKSANEPKQPNQEYYIDKANKMSFARVIFPENEEEVLNDLEKALHKK